MDCIGAFYMHLALFLAAVSRTLSGEPAPLFWETPYSKPYFDNATKRDITVTVGQQALLHCRVRHLGDRAVSWLRKRDLHILTLGIIIYTGDQRFQTLHQEGSDEWTLKISSAQPKDSGTYECQVSVEPKISQAFRLTVIVSKAKIYGNSEIFIKSGNDINLTCVAVHSPIPPLYIYWYREGRLINYSQRGGISVTTERHTKTSKLVIAKAMPSDSGNYTCLPSNSDAASVVVHVINGEHPAAMQYDNSSATKIFFYLNRRPETNTIIILSMNLRNIITNSLLWCYLIQFLWLFLIQPSIRAGDTANNRVIYFYKYNCSGNAGITGPTSMRFQKFN